VKEMEEEENIFYATPDELEAGKKELKTHKTAQRLKAVFQELKKRKIPKEKTIEFLKSKQLQGEMSLGFVPVTDKKQRIKLVHDVLATRLALKKLR
jgi:hypothetical protein